MMSNPINDERIVKITQALELALTPIELTIEDESHLHAGHAGAKSGKGHFSLLIKSDKFNGILPLKRHQMIYQALGDMMETDIHALRIHALSST
jgi:BolA family transcriptional regulator, general stress-responsive regulator